MKHKRLGFALPTVIVSSVVLLMVLVTAISATVAVRNGLQDQYYTELATAASEAGTTYATACLNKNGGQATWTDAKPLRPNTDCNGDVVGGRSAYVFESGEVRTYFSVGSPMVGASNLPISAAVKGYSEVLRSSSGVAWRVWSSDTAVALVAPNDGTPVGSYIDGAWSTPPAGYLLADGTCISTVTYANLYAVIGDTYATGTACGSNQFRLPGAQGRVLVQQSASETEFDTLGTKGGAKTHTLTIAQIPSHTHTYSTNTANAQFSVAGGTGMDIRGTNNATSGSTGGGGAHNNIQPYIVVTRAIKY